MYTHMCMYTYAYVYDSQATHVVFWDLAYERVGALDHVGGLSHYVFIAPYAYSFYVKSLKYKAQSLIKASLTVNRCQVCSVFVGTGKGNLSRLTKLWLGF